MKTEENKTSSVTYSLLFAVVSHRLHQRVASEVDKFDTFIFPFCASLANLQWADHPRAHPITLSHPQSYVITWAS